MPATEVGGRWGKHRCLSKGQLSPTGSLWARVFIDGRRGLHVETVQSALTSIFNRSSVAWPVSSWLLWVRVIFSSKGCWFPFPEGSSENGGSLCHGAVRSSPSQLFHLVGFQYLWKSSKDVEYYHSLWGGTESPWRCLMTKLSLFCPVCLSFLLLLHVFTSLIKLIIWLEFFHRQKTGWGHGGIEGGKDHGALPYFSITCRHFTIACVYLGHKHGHKTPSLFVENDYFFSQIVLCRQNVLKSSKYTEKKAIFIDRFADCS